MASSDPPQRSDDVVPRAPTVVALTAGWVWSLVALFPSFELGIGSPLAAGLAVGFPLVVAVALGLDVLGGPGRARRASSFLMLGVAPVALVGPLAVRSDLVAADVLGPLHLTAMALAAGSYLGAAAWLAHAHEPRRSARAQALPPSSLVRPAAWPRMVRAALIALTSLGALALVTVAPGWGGQVLRVARHGEEGAESAAALATVVGLVVGVTVLGAAVAPALRARQASGPTLPARARTPVWLGLAILSLATWWLLVRASS